MRNVHFRRRSHKKALNLAYRVLLQRVMVPEDEAWWAQEFKERKAALKQLEGGDFKEELKG